MAHSKKFRTLVPLLLLATAQAQARDCSLITNYARIGLLSGRFDKDGAEG